MTTTAEACAEFQQFLNEVGTAHYFSMLGLIHERERVTEMLRVSAAEGKDDPSVFIGNGSPAGEGWAPFLNGSLRELQADLAPGARMSDLVGHMSIITVCTAWETRFRSDLARTADLKSHDLPWPVIGDLRRMRHDIVHHRGIGTKGESGKCEVLGWATSGEMISIGPPHVEQFMVMTAERVRRWQNNDFAI